MPRHDPPPDEDRLVREMQAGGDLAFEELVRHYGADMYRTARRLVRDEHDARDCIQDALIQVLKNVGKFEERSSLKTWLHRIVVNEALMKIRARDRRAETSIEDLMPAFDSDGCRIEPDGTYSAPIETLLESDQNRALVRGAIDRLPEDYRLVIMLRDIEDNNVNETATLLGVSNAVVKTRLHRARAALKRLLEPLLQGNRP